MCATEDEIQVAYNKLSKTFFQENDKGKQRELDESYGVLSNVDSKYIYDMYVHRLKRITSPLVIKLFKMMGLDELIQSDDNGQNLFAANLFSSAQTADHQRGVIALKELKPLSAFKESYYKKLQTTYDDLLKKAKIEPENAPPLFVDVSEHQESNAFYEKNRAENKHLIGFGRDYLKTLTPERFETVCAHELGHINNTGGHVKSLARALPFIKKIAQSSRLGLASAILLGAVTGNSLMIITAVGILATTISLHMVSQTIVRQVNHQVEYKADEFSAKVVGFEQAAKMLQHEKSSERKEQTPQNWVDYWFGRDSHPSTVNRIKRLLDEQARSSDISWEDKVQKSKRNEGIPLINI